MTTVQHPAPLDAPADDGACDHLPRTRLPPGLALPATSGRLVDLSALPPEPPRTVIYAYPRTAGPDGAVPEGWDAIPGARGCTPQSCAFRDHHAELAGLGAAVFGLSTQDTAYQREAAARLHLPFDLLSDAGLRFATALRLPTFEAGGETLIRRVTLVLRGGAVEHAFYPVHPPAESAAVVLRWLRERRRAEG